MNKVARGLPTAVKTKGFTIVETLIVLGVTSLLATSMLLLVSGRQGRTEFSTGVRNFEALLHDVSNDIADGYYSSSAGSEHLSCGSVTATAVKLGTTPTDQQGSNTGCIVIGKAIQFAPQDLGTSQLRVITLFGRQFVDGSPSKGDVQSFNNIGGSGVYPAARGNEVGYVDTPDSSEAKNLGGGLSVECALYANYTHPSFNPTVPVAYPKPCSNLTVLGSMLRVDTLVFMTAFHGTSLSNDSEAGDSRVNLVVFKQTSGTAVGRDTRVVADELRRYATDVKATAEQACDPVNVTSTTCTNPPGGVFICVQSTHSGQYAMINIGGNTSQNSTISDFRSGEC